jgi:hypothetical protein
MKNDTKHKLPTVNLYYALVMQIDNFHCDVLESGIMHTKCTVHQEIECFNIEIWNFLFMFLYISIEKKNIRLNPSRFFALGVLSYLMGVFSNILPMRK